MLTIWERVYSVDMPIYTKWPNLLPDAASYAIDKYLSEQESKRRNLRVNHVYDMEILHKWELEYVSRGVVSSGMGIICLDPYYAPESRSDVVGTGYSYEPHGYSAETLSDYPAELLEIVEGGAAFVELLRKRREFASIRRVLDEGRITGIEDTLTKAYLGFDPEAEVEPDIPKPTTTPRKYGPSKHSDEQKRVAVERWDGIDKGIHPITLSEFLAHEFGSEGGVNYVANPHDRVVV